MSLRPRLPERPGFFVKAMESKNRVMAFVDGFNLYHGIAELAAPAPNALGSGLNHLKWVNLWSLIRAFTKQEKETLVKVYYFSAFATWMPAAYKRHRAYVDALESVGVTVVLGKFKEKLHFCKKCRTDYRTHEEKETDVNLALTMLYEAMQHSFDKAIVVTGDADLKPAVNMVKKCDPSLIVNSLLPKSRFRASHDFQSVCDSSQKFGISHLEKSLLPETIQTTAGKTILRPAEYAPPK
jgi:uncharacterized LabA/DUF88 family protein